MNAIDIWLVIVGLTAVTVISRCTLLLLGDRVRLPPRLEQALRHAPVCALVALVAPVAVSPQATIAATLARPELLGAVAAAASMALTRSVLATMLLGMLAFTLARLW